MRLLATKLLKIVMEEEEAIRYYFQHGYNYNTIIDFLAKFHDIHISRRTLLNRFTSTWLRGRCEFNSGARKT